MKKMLLVFFLLTGCYQVEYSEIKNEKAVVTETVYMPAQHGTGTGISTSGNLVVTSTTIPEEYAVVFKCQHGKFIIKKKNIWEKLIKGDNVIVTFQEEYRVQNNIKQLHGYKFIDANKID